MLKSLIILASLSSYALCQTTTVTAALPGFDDQTLYVGYTRVYVTDLVAVSLRSWAR
jgi:hypothetical protein